MFDGVATDRLRRHGSAAMGALLAGNRFGCRRRLVAVSRRSFDFAGLDRVAEGMAWRCGAAFPRHARSLRQVVQSALDRIEVVVVAGSFYARYAGAEPALVLAEAGHLIASAPECWVADVMGSRVIPALAKSSPRDAWSRLAGWAEAEDPRCRRAVAVGAGAVLRDPARDPRDPARWLGALRRDPACEVRRGVSQALRAMARHHRAEALRTLHTWAREADNRTAIVIRGGMSDLGRSDRRRLEAVLAAH